MTTQKNSSVILVSGETGEIEVYRVAADTLAKCWDLIRQEAPPVTRLAAVDSEPYGERADAQAPIADPAPVSDPAPTGGPIDAIVQWADQHPELWEFLLDASDWSDFADSMVRTVRRKGDLSAGQLRGAESMMRKVKAKEARKAAAKTATVPAEKPAQFVPADQPDDQSDDQAFAASLLGLINSK